MKKNNKLSLWTFSYRKSYYLTHPWKLVKDIYWNVRNFWHRGKYGYAYSDVWNWYAWWTSVGAEALRYLAEHNSGYPGYEPWETVEKWKVYLNDLADKLDWCEKSCDMFGHEDKNEYQEQYDAIHKAKTEFGTDERGIGFSRLNCTPEEEEIIRKYYSREEDFTEEDNQKRAEIFAEIGKNLGRFWD